MLDAGDKLVGLAMQVWPSVLDCQYIISVTHEYTGLVGMKYRSVMLMRLDKLVDCGRRRAGVEGGMHLVFSFSLFFRFRAVCLIKLVILSAFECT